jgi:hypothetical protein
VSLLLPLQILGHIDAAEGVYQMMKTAMLVAAPSGAPSIAPTLEAQVTATIKEAWPIRPVICWEQAILLVSSMGV